MVTKRLVTLSFGIDQITGPQRVSLLRHLKASLPKCGKVTLGYRERLDRMMKLDGGYVEVSLKEF